jgi:hypothetical protein
MEHTGHGPGWNPPGRARVTGPAADRAKLRAKPGVVIPLVTEVLRRGHGTPDPGRRQDVLHPSEMCKANWCHLHTYNRLTGKTPYSDGKFSFVLQNIFAEGNFIHEKWQTWLQQTGQLWGDWYCDRCMATVRRTADPTGMLSWCTEHSDHHWQYKEVTLWNDALNIYGHEDGALVDANCLVEFKSVGLGTLRFEAPELLARFYNRDSRQYDLDGVWKSITRPLSSHIRQVNLYMWLAREMGLPFDKTQVVYEFKVNQQVKEFTVPLSMETVQPMLDKAAEIKLALATGTPPACPDGGCKSCEEIIAPEAAPDDPGGDPGRSSGAPVRVVRRNRRRDDGARLHVSGETPDGNGPDTPGMENSTEGTDGE